MKAKLFALIVAMFLPLQVTALTDLDSTTKSLFFAGRCMAPVLLREPINTKDLREMPASFAVNHLYGQSGRVWHGITDDVVLIELDEGASCGVNAFDEDFDDVDTFMTYWMEREDSPFTERKQETLGAGDIRISYDGFCEACGYHVHARVLWIKEARFTIYRVFATLPEKA